MIDKPEDYPLKPLVDQLPEGHPFRLFSNFARVVWDRVGLPNITSVQADICDHLQFGPTHLQIQAFRGAGKTYLTVAYVLWRLYLNQEEIVLILSAAKSTSDQICRFARRLIDEVPELNHLRPDVSRGDQDSAVSFQVGCATVKKSPSVISKGVTGTITGDRASLVILDDIEVPNNSDTPAMREKLLNRVEEISALMLPPAPELNVYPTVRVLGTPQSTHTIYRTIEGLGYHTKIWPIEKPEPEIVDTYGNNPDGEHRLARMIREHEGAPGTPMEPQRFTPVEIAGLRMKFTRPSYNRQYLLSTDLSDAERFPIKIKDAMFTEFSERTAAEIYIHSNHHRNRLKFDCPGLPGDGFYEPGQIEGCQVPFEKTVMTVDPSGRGADETGIAVVSSLSGYMFVHSVRGLPGGYSMPTLEAIAREAHRYGVHEIHIESNFGDGAFNQLLLPVLQRIHPCRLEEIRNSQRKELRILETLSPPFGANRMVFHTRTIAQQDSQVVGDTTVARDRNVFYQLTHLEEQKGCLPHDDRIDALEMAVRVLTENMNRDAADVQRQRELDDLDQWLIQDGAPAQTWCSMDPGAPSALL
jgi:hypothetical protein